MKAVTFSSVKWPHLADITTSGAEPLEIVRCSVGRIGEEALVQRADEDLAAVAAAELSGRDRRARHSGRAPYYQVGRCVAAVHGGASRRVARIRAAVATQPGLAVCGAAYEGVGIPACVATARAAASQVTEFLRGGRQ